MDRDLWMDFLRVHVARTRKNIKPAEGEFKALLKTIENNFGEFMQHMGDSSMIEAYGSNCNNDDPHYWAQRKSAGQGSKVMMTREDKIVCMLMTGALSFVNGWGTRAKYKEGTSADDRKADEFIKCALANIYMYTLEETRSDAKWGIDYAWYLMKGMEVSEMDNLIKDEKCKKGAQEYGKGPNDQIKNRIRSLLKSKDATFNRIKEDAVENEKVQEVISAAVEKKEEEKVIQRKSGNKDSTNEDEEGGTNAERPEVKTGAGGRASMWNYLIVLWDDYIAQGDTGVTDKNIKDWGTTFWEHVKKVWEEFKEYVETAQHVGRARIMCASGKANDSSGTWTEQDSAICELTYIALDFKHDIARVIANVTEGITQTEVDEDAKMKSYIKCFLVNIFMKKIMGMNCLKRPGAHLAFGAADGIFKNMAGKDVGNIECERQDAEEGGERGIQAQHRTFWQIMDRWFERNKDKLGDGDFGVLGDGCMVDTTGRKGIKGEVQEQDAKVGELNNNEDGAKVKDTVKAEIRNVNKEIDENVSKILHEIRNCMNGETDCIKKLLEKEKEEQKQNNTTPPESVHANGKSPDVQTPVSPSTSAKAPVDTAVTAQTEDHGSRQTGTGGTQGDTVGTSPENDATQPDHTSTGKSDPHEDIIIPDLPPLPGEERGYVEGTDETDKYKGKGAVALPGTQGSTTISIGTSETTQNVPTGKETSDSIPVTEPQPPAPQPSGEETTQETTDKVPVGGEPNAEELAPGSGTSMISSPDDDSPPAHPSNGVPDSNSSTKNKEDPEDSSTVLTTTSDAPTIVGPGANAVAEGIETSQSAGPAGPDGAAGSTGEAGTPAGGRGGQADPPPQGATWTDLIPHTPAIIPAVVGIGLIAFFLWKVSIYDNAGMPHVQAVYTSEHPYGLQYMIVLTQMYSYTRFHSFYPTVLTLTPFFCLRTIIELHLEVLNECEVTEWENVKDDYLQILVEEFAQELMRDDDRNNNMLGVSTRSDGLSRNHVSSTDSKGTDPCPDGDPDPCKCMDNIQFATDPCPPTADDPDPWSCMETIQLEEEQSPALTGPEDATSECTQWINWIDRNKYLLRECTTQPWFLQLKAEWKQYLSQHWTDEVSAHREFGERGNMPSAEMKKVRLWKQWVSQQHRQMSTYTEEEWFQHLLNNVEEEKTEEKWSQREQTLHVSNIPTAQEGATHAEAEPRAPENIPFTKVKEPEQQQDHHPELRHTEQLTAQKLWMLILASVIEECEIENIMQDRELYVDALLHKLCN
ncbi:hypothetical protein AK88_05318 [Plasmodium fragile]|uniref:Schizont-infected cell agglutination C-terminal domain-containing protein n=1 Tax=Plasmodium fragile TaxID=5857 RepID=A0A0D9QDE7_PLAFR|nr:uncharacterized protein AK88_05318 [Plasmodium fragile]KJP85048.1 hypothetical protein AK88_05318 [Plasmodium fragile]